MSAPHPFTRSPVRHGPATASAVETSPDARPPASGDTPFRRRFNGGFRVLWHVGGEPVFRDETGKVRPMSLPTLPTLCALRRRLWTMARDASGRERDRLCVLWAEAEEAYTDTLRWRQAAGWVS